VAQTSDPYSNPIPNEIQTALQKVHLENGKFLEFE